MSEPTERDREMAWLVPLWDAINDFAAVRDDMEGRMRVVPRVDFVVRQALAQARAEGRKEERGAILAEGLTRSREAKLWGEISEYAIFDAFLEWIEARAKENPSASQARGEVVDS